MERLDVKLVRRKIICSVMLRGCELLIDITIPLLEFPGRKYPGYVPVRRFTLSATIRLVIPASPLVTTADTGV
jgi:hypothetical protein